MAKYLNSDGLAYFLSKLKPLIAAKADNTHTHNYAGSSSAGGSANSAVKLDTSAGSATQPVYFTNGKPSACTYTLGCSVPAGAKFTDSWRPVQNVLTSSSVSDCLSAYQGKVLNDTKADRKVWTAKIQCAAWSRICYVFPMVSVTGSSFILNIKGTRNNVVYNETFTINANHSKKCIITKIGTSTFTNGNLWIRGLANDEGYCYIDIWDELNGAETGTYQSITCILIPISSGQIVTYSDFTNGATIPTGYTASAGLEVKKYNLQGDIAWDNVCNRPTTLSGYGITDAAAKTHTHNYAGSNSAGGAANNSLALNGIGLSSGSTVNNRVAYIGADGVLEIGKYIDLHWASGEDKDYTHRVSLADGIGAIKFEPNDKTNVAAVFSTKNPTSGIGFTTSAGMMGYIAFNEVNGNLKRVNNQFNKEYKIYDASNITYGTAAPTAAASNGDIYIQYS